MKDVDEILKTAVERTEQRAAKQRLKAESRQLVKKQKFLTQWDIHLLMLPAMLCMLIFMYVPMYGVIIAFKDYIIGTGPGQGIFGSPWVGFKHFEVMFKDPDLIRSLKNSVGMSLWRILLLFPAPIILALMFNEIKNSGLKRVYQTISYFPYFLSWAIVCSMVQLWLSPSQGWVNALLVNTGLFRAPIDFLSEENWFWPITLILETWKGVGFSTIMFLAAISGIEQEQYEAAVIDGASRLQKIRYITWPSMTGTVSVLFILQIPGIIGGNFDISYLLGNDLNAEKSEILQTLVYNSGMKNMKYSYATAVGLVISAVSLLLLLGGNMLIRKVTKRGIFG